MVLCLLGLGLAGFYWRRLSKLLVQQIAISKVIVPLLQDMPKTTGILGRLESASEESRLSGDLLTVGVKQLGEEQTKVAADLLRSRVRAEQAGAKKGAEAGEAADAALRLSETGKLKLPQSQTEPE